MTLVAEKTKQTKYSKSDLDMFENFINRKLVTAQEDFELLKGQLKSLNDSSTITRGADDGDGARDGLSRKEITDLMARQESFIQGLRNALVRIKNGTYGVCRVTGKLISKERLKLVPHATLSIEAKRSQEE
jgi:RNA polymerase-binding transcription factor DksA